MAKRARRKKAAKDGITGSQGHAAAPSRNRQESSRSRSPSQDDRVGITVGLLIRQLLTEGKVNDCPVWPPDAFAVAATILESTGAYSRVVCKKWPPGDSKLEPWCKHIRKKGFEWWDSGNCPNEIVDWWAEILKCQNVLLSEISDEPEKYDDLICALLQICAVADESCSGIGLPGTTDQSADAMRDPGDEVGGSGASGNGELPPEQRHQSGAFFLDSQELLLDHNLCKKVDKSMARVIPKVQTPQTGFNFRSLTHNIALWRNPEVSPHWYSFPTLSLREKKTKSLNLLLIPWPYEVSPEQFSIAKNDDVEMRDCHQFFDYKPTEIDKYDLVEIVYNLLKKIGSDVKNIDAVVFPELALTEENFNYLAARLAERNLILISGTAGNQENIARCSFPVDDAISQQDQPKHHRWKIDKNQVLQYSLGSTLGTDCDWWEHVQIKGRTVNFFPLSYWLTFCVLICEDLARQDPVATLVRAVGPNLVLALLMDGPQVKGRWSDRYASVLVDDPGSSVLSFTCAGMAQRSCRRNSWNRDTGDSTIIALWRDSINGAVEIPLESDSAAVVVSMNTVIERQFTADGREANEYPRNVLILSGLHQVKAERWPR